MYATVSTWRLHESIRSTESLDQFVREFLTSGIDLARRAGALDVLMIDFDPDRLMGGTVRDPAALAEWFVEQMAPDLRVLNLDADDPPTVDPAAGAAQSATRPARFWTPTGRFGLMGCCYITIVQASTIVGFSVRCRLPTSTPSCRW